MSASRAHVFAVQIGGGLGPLAGGLVAPVLVPIAESFGTSADVAAATLTAYFIPFSVTLVVSGTIGERFGRRRVVRVGYGVFVVGLLLAAVAPSLTWLLVARAIQGFANAFTTPLLLAGLQEMVAPQRRARALGTFAAFQAGGQTFAAAISGVLAAASWRLSFVVVALLSAVLALRPPPGDPRPGTSAPRLRSLFTPAMTLICLASFVTFTGGIGAAFLVALHAQEAFDMSPAESGLVLAGFGIAGFASGSACGGLVGRIGPRYSGIIACPAVGVAVAGCGLTQSPVLLTSLWFAAGGAAALLNVALQTLALDASPSNRSGAASLSASFRFAGGAVAPLLWVPAYGGIGGPATFAVVGGLTALAAVLMGAAGKRVDGRE